jgi:hypothetical protein
MTDKQLDRPDRNGLPEIVCRMVTFCLVGRIGGPGAIAELQYRKDDPYAIIVAFLTGPDMWVEWTVARDLLTEGLIRPAGLGDIRIRPDDTDLGTVRIDLRSPNGEATVSIARAVLAEFLHETYAMVRPGEEVLHLDVDRALADLFDNELS